MRAIDATAERLAALGVRARDRVGVVGATSHRWFIVDLAITELRATTVGISPTARFDSTETMLRDAAAQGLIFTDPIANEFYPSMFEEGHQHLTHLRSLPAPDWWTYFDLTSAPCKFGAAAPPMPPSQHATDLATIIYTSGTTGIQKAVGYTQTQIETARDAILQTLPIVRQGDHAVAWLPMSHLFQRMVNHASIDRGAVIHFVEDARHLFTALPTINPQTLCCVPRVLEKVAAQIQPLDPDGAAKSLASTTCADELAARDAIERADSRRPTDKRPSLINLLGNNLKHVVCGSAPLAPSVHKALSEQGVEVLEAYGVTECAIPVSANRPEAKRLGSVGLPLTGNSVEIAEDGEILVKGPSVMSGYLNTNNSGLGEDGFYHTGDIGHLDSDGYLFIEGRKDSLIKTSTGRKVCAEAVSIAYKRLPVFDEFIVFGAGRPFLVALAWIAPQFARDDLDVALADALQAGDASLDHHQRVARILVVDTALSPSDGTLTESLKVRRQVVEERYHDQIGRLYSEEVGRVAGWEAIAKTRELHAAR